MPREIDPGIADLGGERARARTSSRHRSTTIRVIEYESDFAAVKGARASVENRGLPGKPIIEDGRGVLCGLNAPHWFGVLMELALIIYDPKCIGVPTDVNISCRLTAAFCLESASQLCYLSCALWRHRKFVPM